MLTTGEWAKQVVHGVRQEYTFGEWGNWEWRTMIAAFNDDVRRRVIGTGITAVAVSKRAGSYDHHMAVAAREHGWTNRCLEIVDFRITRTDGTVVLVHPRLDVLEPPPHGTPTAIMPDHGPGRSDGPGTYRRVTGAAHTVSAFTPAVAGPGTPAEGGPGMPAVAAAVIATTASGQTPVLAVGKAPPPPPPPPPPSPGGPAVAGHQSPPPPPPAPPPAAVAATVFEIMD